MRSFILAGLFLLIVSFVIEISTEKRPKKIDLQNIVDTVNKDKNSLWTADTYGYAEIDVKEFVKSKLGVKISVRKKQPVKPQNTKPDESSSLPTNFTWSNAPANMTRGCPIDVIWDQSNCGSCWAVATASAYSDRYCLMTNGTFKLPFSAEYLISCDKSNKGCNGGYMYSAYYWLKYNGTVTGGAYESDKGCQPYSIAPCGYPTNTPCVYTTARTPKCRQKKCSNEWYTLKEEKNTYKISYARSLYPRWYDYETRREIYYNGPLVATFYVYEDFLTYKKGCSHLLGITGDYNAHIVLGIYEHKTGWFVGAHAVRIVGWGETANGTKYWHVANSWSTGWGEDGYFRILRGRNTAYIEDSITALYPIVTEN